MNRLSNPEPATDCVSITQTMHRIYALFEKYASHCARVSGGGLTRPQYHQLITPEQKAKVIEIHQTEPGITQQKIADRVGISQGSVGRILKKHKPKRTHA